MNCEDKVAKAFKMPEMLNLLFESPMLIRTTTTNSHGPQSNVCARKTSFRAPNLLPKPKSSIENNLAKNKCAGDDQCTNTSALERKMRRKSFFERICGSKTSSENTDTPVRVLSPKTDRFNIVNDEPSERLRAETDGEKRSAVNVFNDGVYGSTSTVDSSCLSIEQKIAENMKRANKGFANLNIKKVKLTKNINSQLEFVPLIDRRVHRELSNCEAETSEKRFGISKFVFDFTDLVEDFTENNDKWVQLDEDTLLQVFSKGKY